MTSLKYYSIFNTAAGHCVIAWSQDAVCRFQLPVGTPAEAERFLLRRVQSAPGAEPSAFIRPVMDKVKAYFAGDHVEFADTVLDIESKNDFFSKVYSKVQQLPWGQVTTYGALAKELGAGPEAARDVGQAMAGNPVPLLIPCHRVLAAGGKLGGFSAPGGVNVKKRMLELEGVFENRAESAQASLF